jgi:hypothetical protein
MAEYGQRLVSPDINKHQILNSVNKPISQMTNNYGIDYTSNYKFNFRQPYANNNK